MRTSTTLLLHPTPGRCRSTAWEDRWWHRVIEEDSVQEVKQIPVYYVTLWCLSWTFGVQVLASVSGPCHWTWMLLSHADFPCLCSVVHVYQCGVARAHRGTFQAFKPRSGYYATDYGWAKSGSEASNIRHKRASLVCQHSATRNKDPASSVDQNEAWCASIVLLALCLFEPTEFCQPLRACIHTVNYTGLHSFLLLFRE